MQSSFCRTAIAHALLAVTVSVTTGCAGATHRPVTAGAEVSGATLAQIYLWRARPGKFAEYSASLRDRVESSVTALLK